MPELIRSALNPAVAEWADQLAVEFNRAEPFCHVVIDEFLDSAFGEKLIGEFPPFEKERALNERGEVGRKATKPRITTLGESYRRFDRLMSDATFLELIGKITGISALLYDPDYVGGGTHETLDGGELDLHIDFNYHPGRGWHRRLNLIVFLNREWEEAWGGCLELHRDAWSPETDLVRKVAPRANCAVLFETTEASWHGFNRIVLPPNRSNLSRRSLAIYFYTRDRPASETSGPHATVYVPPPLPSHFRSGHTLSDKDVEILEGLIGRRDTLLQFLYQRERDFAKLIAGISGSLSFRLGRIITAPGRMIRPDRDRH